MTSTGQGQRPPATVLAVVTFLAAGALVALWTRGHLGVPGNPRASGYYGLQDFRDAIYYPAVAVLEGHNPYDAADFVRRYPVATPMRPYLPALLWLYLPLGFLPYTTAGAIFFALNLVLVLVLVHQAFRLTGLAPTAPRVLGLAALVVLSRPGLLTLFVGQSAIYMTLGVYVALRYARTRPALSALGVALVGAKPTFGLPLGFLLLARGEWRPAVLGGVLVGLASAVAAVPMVHAAGGLGAWGTSIAASANMSDDPHNLILQSYFRVDAPSLVGRLFQAELSPAVQALLLALVVALGAAAVWRLARAPDSPASLSASIVCLTTLACVYHQTYDCLLLLAPLLASVSGTLGSGRWRWLLATLLVVPFVNYFATLTVIHALGIEGAAWMLVASLNAAAVAGAFLLLLREADPRH